jgi:hypothetical protein
MTSGKPGRPRVNIAPEFSGLGGLAQALKGSTPAPSQRNSATPQGDDTVWTILGVSSLWQTAAENAARLSGMDLSEWLASTIEDAAAAQGLTPVAASHDAPDDRP